MRKVIGVVIFFIAFAVCNGQKFIPLSSQKSGFDFFNTVTESDSLNIFIQKYPYMGFSGAGLALADLDNDGLEDIVMVGNQVPSKIFKNKGKLTFEDVTQGSNFNTAQWTNGVTVSDVNNDGLLDIFVTKLSYPNVAFGGNMLFINKGKFRFEEKAKDFGLYFVGNSIHASFFDYDKDGFMDLYLINQPLESFAENTFDIFNQGSTSYGQSDILYHNKGGKSFEDISIKAGIVPENAFGLSVVTGDFNQDDFTDIYVCNDYVHRDFMYINNGDGTFADKLAEYFNHTSLFTMGSAFADYNNDGLSDLFTLDMNPLQVSEYKISTFETQIDKYNLLTKNHFRQEVRNSLQINRGNKHFAEIAQFADVAFSDWSWVALAEDFNNDANRDLYITNGLVKNTLDRDFFKYTVDSLLQSSGKSSYGANSLDFYKSVRMPKRSVQNQLHLNNGNLKFPLCTNCGLSQSWVTTSAAVADLDSDGDLDLVLGNSDTNAVIMQNSLGEKGNFLEIKFQNPNDAWNAKINLWVNGLHLFHEITNTQGILCSQRPSAFLGLGNANIIDSLHIRLGVGKVFAAQNVQVNQMLTLKPSDFKDGKRVLPINELLQQHFLFHKSTITGFDFTHFENAFNDLKKEPLLPHQLNAFGPFSAVADLDGNGWDDIVIGGSSGTKTGIFFQDNKGDFKLADQLAFRTDVMREDAGIVIFDADADKDLDIFVVSGGNENFPDSSFYQDRLYLNDGKGIFTKCLDCLPKESASGSEAIAFDADLDGDLDLFVAGRNLPGRFPEASRSYFLKNESGHFIDLTPSILKEPGMVYSVKSADLDGNSFPDLILAGEWMPVLVFWNEKGLFSKPDTLLPEGFWQHLNIADLNGDGKPDILAGNIGLNTRFVPKNGDEVRLYTTDIDGNGSLDPLVCTLQEGKWKPVLPYEKLVKEIPSLRRKFLRYRSYRDATIFDCLGDKAAKTPFLKSNEASSFILFNQGNKIFEKSNSGLALQFSPITTSILNDFDADGRIDILAHGNFYENCPEVGPMDASDGMLLRNGGKHSLERGPFNSGFQVSGNVRNLISINTPTGTKIIVLKNNAKAEVWEQK